MNCCGKLFNLTIFVSNFLFFLTGCAILGLGAYMQANINTFGDFMIDYDVNSAVMLMGLGGVILCLAFLGCMGACTGKNCQQNISLPKLPPIYCTSNRIYSNKYGIHLFSLESACLMYTYATTIAIVLTVEIGAGVALLIFKSSVSDILEQGLVDGLDSYGIETNVTDAYAATTKSWDELQQNMKCCGVTEFTDWGANPIKNATGAVPDSCCKEVTKGCGFGALKTENDTPDAIYTDGCLNKIFDVIQANITWVAIAAACVVAVQVVIICVSCCLGNTMKKAQYEKK